MISITPISAIAKNSSRSQIVVMFVPPQRAFDTGPIPATVNRVTLATDGRAKA